MNKQLSRKYILALASLVSLDVLLWYGKIDGSLFITGLVSTVSAYLAANVIQANEVVK